MLNVPFTALTHNLCFSAQPPERPDTGCLCSAQRGEKTLLEMRVGLLWLIALYPVTEGTKGFPQVSRYMSGFSRQPSLLSTFLLPRNLSVSRQLSYRGWWTSHQMSHVLVSVFTSIPCEVFSKLISEVQVPVLQTRLLPWKFNHLGDLVYLSTFSAMVSWEQKTTWVDTNSPWACSFFSTPPLSFGIGA